MTREGDEITAIVHPVGMETETPDAWEESARIVEAFAAGVGEETAALLEQIASAIRDHATDA
ncbi:hypothetical protein [Sphingomonas montana]|uniref:hypothetical protein n=1 Tax=Sphingomonas montana TaxID=1843236 RepID=UPI00096CF85D|nr:hypothetical protein [Sphingomonas montana]